MFIHTKSTPNSLRRSIQTVESKRIDGRVRQTIVRHLGIAANDDEVHRLTLLGKRLMI